MTGGRHRQHHLSQTATPAGFSDRRPDFLAAAPVSSGCPALKPLFCSQADIPSRRNAATPSAPESPDPASGLVNENGLPVTLINKRPGGTIQQPSGPSRKSVAACEPNKSADLSQCHESTISRREIKGDRAQFPKCPPHGTGAGPWFRPTGKLGEGAWRTA